MPMYAAISRILFYIASKSTAITTIANTSNQTVNRTQLQQSLLSSASSQSSNALLVMGIAVVIIAAIIAYKIISKRRSASYV